MKTPLSTLLFLILFSFSTSIYAQSLLESMGGFETNFVLTSNDKDLEVESQILIKGSWTGFRNMLGVKYRYDVETYFLEFFTRNNIEIINFKVRKLNPWWILNFYDENDEILLSCKPDSDAINISSNQKEPALYTISICLHKIPSILLTKAKRIDLVNEYKMRK